MSATEKAPVRERSPDMLRQNDLPEGHFASRVEMPRVNVLNYLRVCLDHRKTLLRAATWAAIASALLALLLPIRYESVTRLMPPDNQSSSGLAMAAATMSGAAGGLGSVAGDLLGLKSTSDVFVGILGSRTVQDQLIEQFDLRKLYGDRRMTDARKDLVDHTSISVDRKSQIISITVTDERPQRAAAMAQAYVAELNRLVAELSTSSARRERIFLEERLQAVGQDLEAAEKDFSQFASKNTAIDIKEQGRAMVEAAATLQGQLIAAQSQYEGLREIYTDSSPRVRSIKARIDELKRQLEKLGGKGESTTGATDSSSDSLYPSIRKLPLLGVRYADLYRRTRIQEAVLETLTRQYELAKVQEAKEIPTVKVMDLANIPDKKSFPPRTVIVFLGTLLGFSGAIVWIVTREQWQGLGLSDPRRVFAQEVVGTLKDDLPMFSRRVAQSNGGSNGSKPSFLKLLRRDRDGSQAERSENVR